jgi:hypothetical protein
MRSKRNSSIITAYSLLFTVALGIVAEDLWTEQPSARTAARRLPAAKVARVAAKPASPVVAQVNVVSR